MATAEKDAEDVQGEGFEILGHKRPEGKAERTQAKAAAPEEPEAGEAEAPAGAAAEEQYQVDVYTVLRIFVRELGGLAWQKMGLQANPVTNRVERDIEQARVAIDACAALAEKLLPHLQGQEAKDVQALLTDLRLNFVRQAEQG